MHHKSTKLWFNIYFLPVETIIEKNNCDFWIEAKRLKWESDLLHGLSWIYVHLIWQIWQLYIVWHPFLPKLCFNITFQNVFLNASLKWIWRRDVNYISVLWYQYLTAQHDLVQHRFECVTNMKLDQNLKALVWIIYFVSSVVVCTGVLKWGSPMCKV